jgi:hypothetical protein
MLQIKFTELKCGTYVFAIARERGKKDETLTPLSADYGSNELFFFNGRRGETKTSASLGRL